MAATACIILAEIRMREFQTEVARIRLAEKSANDGYAITDSRVGIRGQLQAMVERASHHLTLMGRTPTTSQRGALSS